MDICSQSTTPSHAVGANVQKVLAMMKSHNLALCSSFYNGHGGCNGEAGRSNSPTMSSSSSVSLDQDLADLLAQLQDEFGQLSLWVHATLFCTGSVSSARPFFTGCVSSANPFCTGSVSSASPFCTGSVSSRYSILYWLYEFMLLHFLRIIWVHATPFCTGSAYLYSSVTGQLSMWVHTSSSFAGSVSSHYSILYWLCEFMLLLFCWLCEFILFSDLYWFCICGLVCYCFYIEWMYIHGPSGLCNLETQFWIQSLQFYRQGCAPWVLL